MAFKGDLKNVQLADLFQTLAQNRQEGVLTLSSRGRTHRVHFSQEGVTLLDPAIASRRRLGEILVSAGLATEQDITDALREQAKSKKFLGEVLIERGRITQENLEAILALQVEEEIYELFRTEGGLFEFTEGHPENAAERTAGNIRPLPVDHVILEAARRLDEWGIIQKQIPSLDDVYVATVDPASLADDQECHSVLLRLDGRHDVRDVADGLLASPFSIAKVLTRLVESGAARACRPDELYASAQLLISANDKPRALKLLHRLTTSEVPLAFTSEVAEMFHHAGDPKSAARTRLRVALEARATGRLEDARRELETALREWPGSSAVLEPLCIVLQELGENEAELNHVRQLADVLADAGANEGALKAMERVLELAPADFDARRKYSDLCLRARLKEKAIEVLEVEADRLKRENAVSELALIYKRILSIDAGRKDVKRALARLRRTRADRILRASLIFTVAAGMLALIAIVGIRWHERRSGLHTIEEARQLLDTGDYKRAKSMIDELLDSTSRPEIVQSAMTILDDIDTRSAETTRTLRMEREEAFNKKLAAIQEESEKMSFDVALGDCAKLLQSDLEPYLADRVSNRLQLLKKSFLSRIDAAKECAHDYHEPERDEDVPEVFKKMSAAFPVELITLLPNVRAAALDNAQHMKGAPRDWMLEIVTSIDSFEMLLARVKPELESLRQRNLRLSSLQQLSADYLESVRASEAGNIERSRELLRKVRDSYDQGPLRAMLSKRLERLDAAAASIQHVEDLLEAKDYATANHDALEAAREYGDLQIPNTLGIPVLVRTIPPGAVVFVDGKEAGRAPVLLRVPIGTHAKVRATLDHFGSTDASIDPERAAEQTVELERARAAELALTAKLLSPPVWSEGRLLVASRDGVFYAIDFKDGKARVRSLKTGSISGSLASPVPVKDGFIASVFEGKIFRVDVTGTTLAASWTRDVGGETKSPLQVVGEEVLVATDEGKVIGLALADGTPAWEVACGERVTGAPAWTGSRWILPLAGGALSAVDPAARTVQPPHPTNCDLVGGLVSDGKVVVATTSTGKLVAFDVGTLDPVAAVDLGDLPVDLPRVAWPRVEVALRRGVSVVDLSAKKVVRTVAVDPAPTAIPVEMDGLLFVGSESGVMAAFDPETGEPRLRTHLGTNASIGPPVATDLGWAIYSRDGNIVILQH
jgi:outer membrane protein assembly factor BamB/tetratricopeptide (TPR) repeat protein